jgi:hypothetical protein
VITNVLTPVLTALTGFVAALLNTMVVLGIWHATPEQVASVNALVLAAMGVVATLRANSQHNGTLTPTPNGAGGAD